MIKKFSLYGFLKNLRFFEPFFLLFLREKGLSFLEIGLLFSFREICVNLMEIPSGALADLYGRKSVMLISLFSYIIAFLLFGTAPSIWFLYLAMFFFAIGEAFRTGTHKAIIFDWLRHEGRESEKTKVYGYTRSWSQKGSALSVLLAAGLVFYTGNYEYVFWFSIIPYLFGLWNIATYPSWLNRKIEKQIRIKNIFAHLWKSIKFSFRKPPARQLILQSMVYTGKFKAIRDYLQIIIKAQVVLLPAVLVLEREKQTALMIGIIYFVLYLLTSVASKNSFRIVEMFKNKQISTFVIIVFTILILAFNTFGAYFELYWIPIVGFVLIYILQNLYRPILISSFDDCAQSDQKATILSIESQSVSFSVFLVAPVIGWTVDRFGFPAIFWIASLMLSTYVMMMLLFSRGSFKTKANDPDVSNS